MRFDRFADHSGQELTPVGAGERTADEEAALKAIHANWRDDVERTSVMQPKFLAPAYAAARAAGVSAPKPADYDEDGPTGTYHERDLWPVTYPAAEPSPRPKTYPARASLPPRSSATALKPRYPTPLQASPSPRYTRNPPSHTPTRVSVAPPAPDPLPPLPAAEPRAVSPKYPVPAAVWSARSASTVPPSPRRVSRAAAKPAAAVPLAPPAPAYSTSPPPLPRRSTVPAPLGAAAPLSLPLPTPRPSVRAQTPAWFSPEDYAQAMPAPPPAAIAQAPLAPAPVTSIFDPGALLPSAIEEKPARWRVIFEALQTRIGPWTRRRTFVLTGVTAALVCAGSLWAWTQQRPAPVAAIDPGPSNAEVARILFARTGFNLTTSPPGAWITVDGRPTGRITPERVSGFTPGLHAIELKLPGYYDTSLPAVLEEGSTLILPPVRLRPLPAAGTAQ